MPSLMDLPNELLEFIGNQLDAKNLNSLMRTNSLFEALFFLRLEKLALLDYGGMPSICWGAQRGHYYLVLLLLGSGVDIHSWDIVSEETPLHKAARGGHVKIARLLLTAEPVRARLDFHNAYQNTELHIAAFSGHLGMVELLLNSGSSIEFENDWGESVLYAAVKGGSEEVVRMILRRARFPKWGLHTINGDSVLHLAIREANLKVASMLIAEDILSLSPPQYHRQTSSERKIYIEHLANGKTPLQEAVISGCNQIIEILLNKGANIEAIGSFGMDITPTRSLHMAMTTKDITVVKLLLSKGAKIDSQDRNGKTPLQWAVGYRFDLAIDLLLEKGAKTWVRGNCGTRKCTLQWV